MDRTKLINGRAERPPESENIMSKIGQSIIDTKNENIAASSEPERQLTAEELAEAEKIQALYSAKSTLLNFMFEFSLFANGIEYHVLYLNESREKPDDTIALATLASVYKWTPEKQSELLKLARDGGAVLRIYPTYIYDYEDIKSNHIPF